MLLTHAPEYLPENVFYVQYDQGDGCEPLSPIQYTYCLGYCANGVMRHGVVCARQPGPNCPNCPTGPGASLSPIVLYCPLDEATTYYM
jgi:hypothetical protein